MFDEDQLPLFDVAPYIAPVDFAVAGSQRWIQIAVELAPHLLLEGLRPTLRLDANVEIAWRSPRAAEGFREYRDRAALRQLGIRGLPKRSLRAFWPEGGPIWDALGKTSQGEYIFVESKAHIAEIFSPATRASPLSRVQIERSLHEAQRYFVPGLRAARWSGSGYQYANRLAFHYLFHTINQLPSHMVFLYFTGAREMHGPQSPSGWYSAIRQLHARLGLPADFQAPNLHKVFLDTALLHNCLHDGLR